MSETDAGLDTVVAGLRCRDVLDELSEFLDGTLVDERLRAVQMHLADCDRCARFGGDVARTLEVLRASLGAPPAIERDQADRLRERIHATYRIGDNLSPA